MRTILAGCVALSALGFAFSAPANADVVIRTPGVAVQSEPYWRGHHDSDWQARREFREHEYQQHSWVREHCVRDYSGGEYCRR
jgi:hypothetical protein